MSDEERPRARLEIALEVDATWELSVILRAMVISSVDAATADRTLCEAAGMVTSELIENAVRYGAFAEHGPRRVGLRVDGEEDVVEIVVSSPVVAEGEPLRRFRATLAWIASLPSAREAYAARVRELAEGPPSAGSRMGLVRIVAEAACELDARVDEASLLHVRAVVRRRPPT